MASCTRNTFLDAPRLLDSHLRLTTPAAAALPAPVYVAGQISGTEGYCEAIRSGLHAALAVAADLRGVPLPELPRQTAFGALLAWACDPATADYQPMHVNFGIMEPLRPAVRNKRERYAAYAARGPAGARRLLPRAFARGASAGRPRRAGWGDAGWAGGGGASWAGRRGVGAGRRAAGRQRLRCPPLRRGSRSRPARPSAPQGARTAHAAAPASEKPASAPEPLAAEARGAAAAPKESALAEAPADGCDPAAAALVEAFCDACASNATRRPTPCAPTASTHGLRPLGAPRLCGPAFRHAPAAAPLPGRPRPRAVLAHHRQPPPFGPARLLPVAERDRARAGRPRLRAAGPQAAQEPAARHPRRPTWCGSFRCTASGDAQGNPREQSPADMRDQALLEFLYACRRPRLRGVGA